MISRTELEWLLHIARYGSVYDTKQRLEENWIKAYNEGKKDAQFKFVNSTKDVLTAEEQAMVIDGVHLKDLTAFHVNTNKACPKFFIELANTNFKAGDTARAVSFILKYLEEHDVSP